MDHRVPMWIAIRAPADAGHHEGIAPRLGARVVFMRRTTSSAPLISRTRDRCSSWESRSSTVRSIQTSSWRRQGRELSMAILARPHVAGRWMDLLTACAPSATTGSIYTVDLHWLRESRRIDGVGAVPSDGEDRVEDKLPAKARVLRAALELAMIKAETSRWPSSPMRSVSRSDAMCPVPMCVWSRHRRCGAALGFRPRTARESCCWKV